jgi:YHS domain-containing protein
MKIKLIAIFTILILSTAPLACAGKTGVQETGVLDVGNKICPVMGGEVNPDISYVYEGKRYFFCCPACVGEFKKNPEKYIVKVSK